MKISFQSIADKIKNFNRNQKIAAGVLTVAIGAGVITSVVTVSKYASANGEPISFSELSSFSSYISSMVSSASSEDSSSESKKDIKITLRPSSVEEDLEVQIVDEKGELITNDKFILTVKGKNVGYNKDWTVGDGFLKLTKLKAGNYTVSIRDKDGYIMPEPIECKVAEKVKYVKMDVSDKLVDDSKVNSAKEDAGYGATEAKPTPAPVTDTVEYVETGKKEVEKDVEVIKYKPVVVEDGTIKNKNTGESTKYHPILDSEGYITGAYYIERVPKTRSQALNMFWLRVYADEPTSTAEPTSTPEQASTPEQTSTA